MGIFARAQETRAYYLDQTIFAGRRLFAGVSQALASDTINANDLQPAANARGDQSWLYLMATFKQHTETVSDDLVGAIRSEMPAFTSDQQVRDTITAIRAAMTQLQNRLFATYPRSANGYLEGYEWTAADVLPTPRVVSPIPAGLRTDMEALIAAYSFS